MTWDRPPFLRHLRRDLVLNISTVGRFGKVKKAPGTYGSFAGVIWYMVVFWRLNAAEFIFLYLLTNLFSIWICGEAEYILEEKDPQCVVLDEFCAIPLCFFGIDRYIGIIPMWLVILTGFLLFRLFDIRKPFGIRRLQNLSGGIGIVVDDIAAAFATCICLNFLLFFVKF